MGISSQPRLFLVRAISLHLFREKIACASSSGPAAAGSQEEGGLRPTWRLGAHRPARPLALTVAPGGQDGPSRAPSADSAMVGLGVGTMPEPHLGRSGALEVTPEAQGLQEEGPAGEGQRLGET